MLDEAKIREAVKGAQAMGWTIVPEVYVDSGRRRCCPMGSLFLETDPGYVSIGDGPDSWMVAKALGEERAACASFADGFDGDGSTNAGSAVAFALGQKFRRELLPEVDHG